MKRHEVRIGGNTFYIRRFDPFTATEILGDLQRDFAGPLLAGMGARKAEDGGTSAGGERFMGALAELSSRMDGQKLRRWAERLLDPDAVAVSVDGADAEKLTRQKLLQIGLSSSDLIALCVESVKFNFEDFRERWSGLISSALSRMAPSQSGSSAQN